MGSRSPMASGLATSQAAIDSYSRCRAAAVVSLTSVWNDLELDADDRLRPSLTRITEQSVYGRQPWCRCAMSAAQYPSPSPFFGPHTSLIDCVNMAGRSWPRGAG